MDNELTHKLYKVSIGSKLNIIGKDGTSEGTFIRVPTGWIYRYINRSSLTSCFIPYSDNINYYDMDMPIKPCFSCDSKNVRLVHNDSLQNIWHGECLDCGARAGNVEGKQFALTLWNNTIRKK